MRYTFAPLLWAVFFVLCNPAGSPLWADTEVVWVEDGDTIVLEDGRRIRYIDINAPEIAHKDKPGEPFGKAAKTHNETLVLKKNIRVAFDSEKTDRYGRLLAYVFLTDGRFVNQMMLAEGLAYCLFHPPNTRYHHRFLNVQRTAMSKQTGIWQHLNSKNNIRYVGNKNSRRFHTEACLFGKKIQDANRVVFIGIRDAFWAGYAPCKRCMPD
jgi:micrococcal nuclease